MRKPFDFGLLALIAFAGSSACGAHETKRPAEPPRASSGSETGKTKFSALLARESSALSERDLSGHGFRARVVVNGEPSVADEANVPRLILPIGSQAPVHCFVYPADPDPGSSIAALIESVGRQLKLADVETGPVEVIREAPVATLSGVYTTSTPKGEAVGQLKVAFHSRFGSSSMCLHDEVGYRNTFSKVARSVFETLDRGTDARVPDYIEILAAEINGRPAGYERMFVLTEQGGERKVIATGLALLLTKPADLFTQDYASVLSVDAQDRMTKARFTEAKNGTRVLDLELTRKGGKNYEYAGESAGKTLSGKLSTKDEGGLPSPLWTQKELAWRLASGGAFEFAIEQYRPSEQPDLLSRIAYTRAATDPPRTVLVKMDKVQARSTLDGEGREERSEMNVQGVSLVMKRIYRRGQP